MEPNPINRPILVVDHDEVLFSELGERLSEQRNPMRLVGKGSDALRILQSENIGLLVLNVHCCSLPVEEMVPIIRGIDRDLPIIVTCDKNTPDLEKQIRAQNIFYYHIKSFGVFDLELAVKNALSKGRKKSRVKEGE